MNSAENRTVLTCADLAGEIDRYAARGYRLEMIFPADAPRAAILSRFGETVRLEQEAEAVDAPDGEWHVGRAGMEYRDLIPDRLGGRFIASHIRIPKGGPIPDYVHYHRVRFQMIYCLRGTARLVYEDQGGPFEFRAGDCVLQPPEIRHRVLECSDGFEVLEIGTPAEHPTFVEHGFDLPTERVDPERYFGGQLFAHHRADLAELTDAGRWKTRDAGIAAATGGLADVSVLYADADSDLSEANDGEFLFFFVVSGLAVAEIDGSGFEAASSDSVVVRPGQRAAILTKAATELIRIKL